MGRANPNFTPPPPNAIRRAQRAKDAKHIINNVIPALLKSDTRARKGADSSILIHDAGTSTDRQLKTSNGPPSTSKPDDTQESSKKSKGNAKSKGKSKSKKHHQEDEDDFDSPSATPNPTPSKSSPPIPLRIRILPTDTLHAAQTLHLSHSHFPSSSSTRSAKPPLSLLNMSSPLRPGGGVLRGATSQEETLCTHTTLLPSLRDEFYRLPERGCVFTPDVLVFSLPDGAGYGKKNGGGKGDGEARMLARAERFYVSVVSAAALRFPEVEDVAVCVESTGTASGTGEDGDGSGGEVHMTTRYTSPRSAALMKTKMAGVLHTMRRSGARCIVLGAWGCGAYGNPVGEVARLWREVLLGSASSPSSPAPPNSAPNWAPIEEVVFAIKDGKMAREFGTAWGKGIVLEERTERKEREVDAEVLERRRLRRELDEKIKELEGRMEKSVFPERVRGVLEALRKQRAELGCEEGESESEATGGEVEDDEDGDEDDEVTWSDDGS